MAYGHLIHQGDRDGHPFVTADVTDQTLRELHTQAMGLIDEALQELAVRLSLSDRVDGVPEDLTAWIDATVSGMGESGLRAVARNPEESWRQYVNLIRARLPGGDSGASYREFDQLLDDVVGLRTWLAAVGAERLAEQGYYDRGVERHLDAVHLREAYVEDDEVGLESDGLLEGGASVSGLPDDLDGGLPHERAHRRIVHQRPRDRSDLQRAFPRHSLPHPLMDRLPDVVAERPHRAAESGVRRDDVERRAGHQPEQKPAGDRSNSGAG